MTQTKHLCNFPSTALLGQLKVQVLVGNFYRHIRTGQVRYKFFPGPGLLVSMYLASKVGSS